METTQVVAAAKPVLPPISGTPREDSGAPTSHDELPEKINVARTTVATLRQAGGGFLTDPSKYTKMIGNLFETINANKADRVPLLSACQQEGICELCIETWPTFGFHDSEQLLKLERKQKEALDNWAYVHCLVLCGTDTGDKDIISRLVACGIIKFSVELLETNLFHPSKHLKIQSFISVNLLGTLYNVARMWDGGAENVRSVQGTDLAVAKYTSNADPAVKTLAIIVLTFLLSEDEQKKMLESTEANIKYMIQILDDCLKSTSKDHVGKFGYSAVEIMDALTRMAAVEVNKEKIVSDGALLHYAKVLDGSEVYSTEEQEEACKGLWTLAFSSNNKARIAADAGCMEGLRRAVASAEASVRKAAEGALWVIEGESKRVQSLTAAGDKDLTDGHIMLSYNWAVQKQVIRVKDDLKAAGYRVWIDTESMTGSTLEAMSKAVEDSRLVLIFVTEKYKLSSPCRLEAEYAYHRRKKLIPIKMERGYEPDGWLGLLVANKLFFDFTKEGKWETIFSNLCSEINRMMLTHQSDQADGELTLHTATSDYAAASDAIARGALQHPKANYATLAANSWSERDLQRWLSENKLDSYAGKLSGLSGQHVIALRRLMDTAPEFFYRTLKRDLGFVFLDMLTFSNMLQDLQ